MFFLQRVLAQDFDGALNADAKRAEAGQAAYANDWPRAAAAFQSLADASPRDAELQRRLADARLGEKNYPAAIDASTFDTPSTKSAAQALGEQDGSVLVVLSDGEETCLKSFRNIAGVLVLSIRTVERHISTIYEKLHPCT